MLLHTEYSLLSLLHNQDGVVHHHGLFQVNGKSLLGCATNVHVHRLALQPIVMSFNDENFTDLY